MIINKQHHLEKRYQIHIMWSSTNVESRSNLVRMFSAEGNDVSSSYKLWLLVASMIISKDFCKMQLYSILTDWSYSVTCIHNRYLIFLGSTVINFVDSDFKLNSNYKSQEGNIWFDSFTNSMTYSRHIYVYMGDFQWLSLMFHLYCKYPNRFSPV